MLSKVGKHKIAPSSRWHFKRTFTPCWGDSLTIANVTLLSRPEALQTMQLSLDKNQAQLVKGLHSPQMGIVLLMRSDPVPMLPAGLNGKNSAISPSSENTTHYTQPPTDRMPKRTHGPVRILTIPLTNERTLADSNFIPRPYLAGHVVSSQDPSDTPATTPDASAPFQEPGSDIPAQNA